MINQGSSVDATNDFNETPIHKAILHQHSDTAKMMLSYCKDTTIQDSLGDTYLHTAMQAGQTELLNDLLHKGSKLMQKIHWDSQH